MHILSWLAVNGTAAIVEFPGVLYRGGAEQKIRKYLVDNNYVDTVIQLPPDLFFGTTIATCIIVLKKSKADNEIAVHRRVGGVRPPGQQEQAHRRQPAADPRRVHRPRRRRPLRRAGRQRRRSPTTATTSRSRSYVEAEDTREAIDITALNAEIARIVARQAELRDGDRRDRRRPRRRRRVSRIDDLIAELCPDGVEFKTLGEVGEFIRGQRASRRRTSSTRASACIHYGQIYTDYGTSTTDDEVVRDSGAGRAACGRPSQVTSSSRPRARTSKTSARRSPGSATTEIAISGDSLHLHARAWIRCTSRTSSRPTTFQIAEGASSSPARRSRGSRERRLATDQDPCAAARGSARDRRRSSTIDWKQLEAELEAELEARSPPVCVLPRLPAQLSPRARQSGG